MFCPRHGPSLSSSRSNGMNVRPGHDPMMDASLSRPSVSGAVQLHGLSLCFKFRSQHARMEGTWQATKEQYTFNYMSVYSSLFYAQQKLAWCSRPMYWARFSPNSRFLNSTLACS